MRFEGRTVLVTGATRGIGRALVKGLGERGARLIAVARDAGALADLSRHEAAVTATMAADLADPDETDRLVARLAQDHPELSVIVNNAGVQATVNFFDPAAQAEPRAWRAEIAVNLDAVVRLSTGLLAQLRAQPSAAIVNISSGLAIAPKRSAPVYCATKAAVRSFTRALRYQAQAEAPTIRVVDVIMSLVDTDMTAGRGAGKISAERAAAELLARLAQGRDEIAIGRSRLLLRLNRLSPSLAARIMRDG